MFLLKNKIYFCIKNIHISINKYLINFFFLFFNFLFFFTEMTNFKILKIIIVKLSLN